MSKPSTSVSFGTWFLPNRVPETVTAVPSAIAPRTVIEVAVVRALDVAGQRRPPGRAARPAAAR